VNPVAYFPGKLGDSVLQWPAARAWSRKIGKPIDVWLDEKSSKHLKPLLEVQPEVGEVKLTNQSVDYTCGGQPWDGNFPTEVHAEREIVSFGLRAFPSRQITLQTLHDVPMDLGTKIPDEPQFEVGSVIQENRVVLHGTFTSHHSGVPGFWKFLNRVQADLDDRFEQVMFVGTEPERRRALELYPRWSGYADDGDFLVLARLLAGSRLVMGSGSSVVALGGALRVPTVRVHDPIGEHPKVLWSNLGQNQINETEAGLRKIWPIFRDNWVPKLVSV
jgi:hypothetical protein